MTKLQKAKETNMFPVTVKLQCVLCCSVTDPAVAFLRFCLRLSAGVILRRGRGGGAYFVGNPGVQD